MKKASHMMMGRLLYRYIKQHYKISLDEKSFLRGNLLPDYLPTVLTRPHDLQNSTEFVQSLIRELAGLPYWQRHGRSYSRRLGMLCHFYADFFCYAHRGRVMENLREHVRYEVRLQNYFYAQLEQLKSLRLIGRPVGDASADDIFRSFEQRHDRYLQTRPSFETDLVYAFAACADAIGSIVLAQAGQSAFALPGVVPAV